MFGKIIKSLGEGFAVIISKRRDVLVIFFLVLVVAVWSWRDVPKEVNKVFLVLELCVLVLAVVVTTVGYINQLEEFKRLVGQDVWEVAQRRFLFDADPIILLGLFILAMLFVGTMTGVYFLYCFSNWRYSRFFRLYRRSFQTKEKAISLLCQNIYFFREENYITIFAYCLLCLVCFIISAFPFAAASEESLTAFAAGAATIHLTLSGLRFLKLLRFDAAGDKDLFDVAAKWIVSREHALRDLFSVSRSAFGSRYWQVKLVAGISGCVWSAAALKLLFGKMVVMFPHYFGFGMLW